MGEPIAADDYAMKASVQYWDNFRTSLKTDQIDAAMAEFQGAIAVVRPDREVNVKHRSGGQHSYKYTTHSEFRQEVNPHLKANGLSLICMTSGTMMICRLSHASGQFYMSAMDIRHFVEGQDVQGMGSVLTYCKRYSEVLITGTAVGDDCSGEDQRGRRAERLGRQAQAEERSPFNPDDAKGPAPQTGEPDPAPVATTPDLPDLDERYFSDEDEGVMHSWFLSVEVVTTGTNKRGPWHKWEAVATTGERLVTFNHGELLQDCVRTNTGATVRWRHDRDRNQYEIREISPAPGENSIGLESISLEVLHIDGNSVDTTRGRFGCTDEAVKAKLVLDQELRVSFSSVRQGRLINHVADGNLPSPQPTDDDHPEPPG
jgi:hypothetical protein